jgi:RNA 2',3'-cyclic 3'-phosphodiesterase
VRLFVAVFPPLEIREKLHHAALNLPIEGAVRWVRPENVHLTLKFLGNAREEDLDGIVAATGSVCARHERFEATTSGFGAFPSARRARVVWAGVGEGSERLRVLAEDLEAALEPLGFERERRPYAPHVTLGRARGRPVVLGEGVAAEPMGFRVERVDVVRSVLREGGAFYEVLESRELAEAD